jgi:uncharacterized repeat protein (TIGR03803 family)
MKIVCQLLAASCAVLTERPDRHSATPFEYLEEFIEPRRLFMKQMKHLRQQKPFHIVATFTLALAGIAIPAQAQTFTLLHSFAGYNTDGAYPNGLVQGANGYLYGTTFEGGTNFYGTVFKVNTSGTETILQDFSSVPYVGNQAALVQASNGDFYGTTYSNGLLYKITPSGAIATLHTFCSAGLPDCPDGASPEATLVQASNGDLYGTTQAGGTYGQGTIFKATLAGALTTLHSFCETQNTQGYCLDGGAPYTPLVQGANGNLYGATHTNGAYGYGTIFQITQAGEFATLYNFCSVPGCPDGGNPTAALVPAADGNLYGVTFSGGGVNGGGTFFTMTPSGTLTTLYNFCSGSADCVDGAQPLALMLATDGNFYGMAAGGGASGFGTIFQITPGGTLTTDHSFDGTDGIVSADFQAGPWLIQDTSGKFYGVTPEGGADYLTCSDCNGTVFSLSMGLGPFVKTLPASGRVGAAVKILGNRLTGATRVTFNGVASAFDVASSTEITTTVPTGATTGVVEVVTSRGTTLKSNVVFTIP